MTQFTVSRRTFLLQTAAVGGSLVVGFHLPQLAHALGAGAGTEPNNSHEINAWMYYGGGLELWQEMYAEVFNVVPC